MPGQQHDFPQQHSIQNRSARCASRNFQQHSLQNKLSRFADKCYITHIPKLVCIQIYAGHVFLAKRPSIYSRDPSFASRTNSCYAKYVSLYSKTIHLTLINEFIALEPSVFHSGQARQLSEPIRCDTGKFPRHNLAVWRRLGIRWGVFTACKYYTLNVLQQILVRF